MSPTEDGSGAGHTPWSRALRTPLQAFVHAEISGAVVLLVAAVAALVWANVGGSSYETVWNTTLSIRLGSTNLAMDLRAWVNSGLMTFFFFVVGLEARREADLGELRETRRVALPLLAGLGGMAVPVGIFLAVNAGTSAAHGWGTAMSTDTAFALGVLTLVGPRFADRLRAFLLTVVVVDDIVALLVIASAYTREINRTQLFVAAGLFAVALIGRALGVRLGLAYLVVGIAMWLAMVQSGIDPLIVGLVFGFLAYARPAAREDLERTTREFRLFREQPTPELARRARVSLEAALSPNDRLAQIWHPWTSYLVVPLFALANAGIPLNGSFLRAGFTSALTLSILFAYAVGKPVGIAVCSSLVTAVSRGRLRPPVGWGAVIGAGSVAGVGFTVSLLIASLAFHGRELQQAKLGVLASAALAPAFSWLVFRGINALPVRPRIRALLGTSTAIVDLADPVDPERDHVRGPADGAVVLVEYGDLECPYCGRAEPVIRELLQDFTDLTYVWRHLPLDDVHPHARLAAEATEAAAAQGAFWEMHDLLFSHQDALRFSDLVRYAEQLQLDVDRFTKSLRERSYSTRVSGDVDSADLSGVSGTPTFFVNGRRHHGAFDLQALKAAVKAAGARAVLA